MYLLPFYLAQGIAITCNGANQFFFKVVGFFFERCDVGTVALGDRVGVFSSKSAVIRFEKFVFLSVYRVGYCKFTDL
ncbi:MAG: hypothetical protein IPH31_18195 [Lewinellaceae bacterium]|nr:hypothetical protein [Lewinellaceae bacterium]